MLNYKRMFFLNKISSFVLGESKPLNELDSKVKKQLLENLPTNPVDNIIEAGFDYLNDDNYLITLFLEKYNSDFSTPKDLLYDITTILSTLKSDGLVFEEVYEVSDYGTGLGFVCEYFTIEIFSKIDDSEYNILHLEIIDDYGETIFEEINTLPNIKKTISSHFIGYIE